MNGKIEFFKFYNVCWKSHEFLFCAFQLINSGFHLFHLYLRLRECRFLFLNTNVKRHLQLLTGKKKCQTMSGAWTINKILEAINNQISEVTRLDRQSEAKEKKTRR